MSVRTVSRMMRNRQYLNILPVTINRIIRYSNNGWLCLFDYKEEYYNSIKRMHDHSIDLIQLNLASRMESLGVQMKYRFTHSLISVAVYLSLHQYNEVLGETDCVKF